MSVVSFALAVVFIMSLPGVWGFNWCRKPKCASRLFYSSEFDFAEKRPEITYRRNAKNFSQDVRLQTKNESEK